MSVEKTVWVVGDAFDDKVRLHELVVKVTAAQVRVVKGNRAVLGFRSKFRPDDERFCASPREAWEKYRANAVERLQRAREDADEAARDIGMADEQIAECQS